MKIKYKRSVYKYSTYANTAFSIESKDMCCDQMKGLWEEVYDFGNPNYYNKHPADAYFYARYVKRYDGDCYNKVEFCPFCGAELEAECIEDTTYVEKFVEVIKDIPATTIRELVKEWVKA